MRPIFLFYKANIEVGEISAILTSVFWTLSAIIFTQAGKRLGALMLNRVRLLLAVVLLSLSHLIFLGSLFPKDVSIERWLWLGLSGFIGLTLGDLALFQAYLMIGPRLGTLIMATVPVYSAVLAWLFLGENLKSGTILGILLAVTGVMIVVLDRPSLNGKPGHDRRHYWMGLFFGFLAAAGQTGGLILTKRGLAGGFPALSGVLIRMVVAAGIMWIFTLLSRQARATFTAVSQSGSFGLILLGSLVGPFAGIWLSTIAVQSAPIGVASTLMSLNPIFLLPVARWVYHERISWLAIVGTLMTIGGVTLIFLI